MVDGDTNTTGNSSNTTTKKFNLADILTLSDLLTLATSAGYSSAYGEKPTSKSLMTAFIVSIVGRTLASNFPDLMSKDKKNREPLSEPTKSLIVQTAMWALVGYGMNKPVARTILSGVSADLLAETVLAQFGVEDKVLIGSGK
jgi:hypothetical protein